MEGTATRVSPCAATTRVCAQGRGKRCGQFLGYPWFAVALEIAVLAGTITAWVHSYVHR